MIKNLALIDEEDLSTLREALTDLLTLTWDIDNVPLKAEMQAKLEECTNIIGS